MINIFLYRSFYLLMDIPIFYKYKYFLTRSKGKGCFYF